METLDTKNGLLTDAKKTYSRVGFACILFIVVPMIISSIFEVLPLLFPKNEFFKSEIFKFIYTSVPQYLVGMPLLYLVTRSLPKSAPQKTALTAEKFIIFLLIAWFFMEVGGFASTGLTHLLDKVFKTESNNLITMALTDMPLYLSLISLCVIAPIFEELVFRKFIIDRTRRFGEITAIVISAMMFSLFHLNIPQLLYAFLIGLVFGYVYMRHGNILHTMILHAVLNFIGGALPLIITVFAPQGAALGSTLSIIYYCVTIPIAVAGLVLLIKKARFIKIAPAKNELEKKDRAKVSIASPGMLTFLIVTVLFTVIVAFSLTLI